MLILHENRSLPGVLFMRMSGKPTDEELEVYLKAERERVARDREQRLVIVMELEDVWSSKHRTQMRDFEEEMESKRKTRALGLAVAVPNSLIRGAFTAFFWLAPPKVPTKMVSRSADAWEWVCRQLELARMSAPSRIDFERTAASPWPARQAVPGRGMVPVDSASGRRTG